jgi:hypothetical protein
LRIRAGSSACCHHIVLLLPLPPYGESRLLCLTSPLISPQARRVTKSLLPLDICKEIIDWLPPDKWTLQACTFVHSSWREHAARHLCATITIRSQDAAQCAMDMISESVLAITGGKDSRNLDFKPSSLGPGRSDGVRIRQGQ